MRTKNKPKGNLTSPNPISINNFYWHKFLACFPVFAQFLSVTAAVLFTFVSVFLSTVSIQKLIPIFFFFFFSFLFWTTNAIGLPRGEGGGGGGGGEERGNAASYFYLGILGQRPDMVYLPPPGGIL